MSCILDVNFVRRRLSSCVFWISFNACFNVIKLRLAVDQSEKVYAKGHLQRCAFIQLSQDLSVSALLLISITIRILAGLKIRADQTHLPGLPSLASSRSSLSIVVSSFWNFGDIVATLAVCHILQAHPAAPVIFLVRRIRRLQTFWSSC